MSTSRPFSLIAALIFLAMALLHAYRLLTHFQVVLGSHVIPQWVSWLGVLVPGVVAVMLFREAKR
jgi:protein-S-isoprenylcysteine O-methyltransferase Ste14